VQLQLGIRMGLQVSAPVDVADQAHHIAPILVLDYRQRLRSRLAADAATHRQQAVRAHGHTEPEQAAHDWARKPDHEWGTLERLLDVGLGHESTS
jgi:hypothetical protein